MMIRNEIIPDERVLVLELTFAWHAGDDALTFREKGLVFSLTLSIF